MTNSINTAAVSGGYSIGKKRIKQKTAINDGLCLAAELGFEPRQYESES